RLIGFGGLVVCYLYLLFVEFFSGMHRCVWVEVFFLQPPFSVDYTPKSSTFHPQKLHLSPPKAPPFTPKSSTYLARTSLKSWCYKT
ncbi:hypothetical protein, partial [Shigella sonnei]|uniref:hypothetical protein n=1 Tax=Shigella sonnei TaxID=624 RepID=UPI001C0A7528